jgi:N-acetylmuramoyl-L-alanine amidase
MIGSTINPNTGDYSRGASGFWVENGEINHAVNECTIAGNLRDMLMRIVPANDVRLHLSRVIPSILIETAFISNPSEEAKLADPQYQNNIADALVKGLQKYFERNPPLARKRST